MASNDDSTPACPKSIQNIGSLDFSTETMRRLDESAPRLAGALGAMTTEPLYDLITPKYPECMQIIHGYHQDLMNNFNSGEVPWNLRHIKMSMVFHAHAHVYYWYEALMYDEPPQIGLHNVTLRKLWDIRALWWIVRFLRTRPLGLGEKSQLAVEPFVLDAKEVFLAWKTLSYFHIRLRREPDLPNPRRHVFKAIPPTFAPVQPPVHPA